MTNWSALLDSYRYSLKLCEHCTLRTWGSSLSIYIYILIICLEKDLHKCNVFVEVMGAFDTRIIASIYRRRRGGYPIYI